MTEYTFERINHTFHTNEMDLVLVTVNKVFLLPILHTNWKSRYKRYVTYGIRAKLKCLDLMDSSTCRYVVNYVTM